MDRFLRKIAEIYYSNIVEKEDEGLNLSQVLFVFPNRRAGLFFRKEMRALAQKNIFAPNVTDINKLAEEFAQYEKGNDIELLIELYKSYIRIRSKHLTGEESIEPFDAFIGFGTTLLSDFNEIDKYMVETELLFRNIADIKNMTDYSQFLSENQIKAIESFWNHVSVREEENLTFKKEFISLWDDMLEIYNDFKENLEAKNIAYEGMIYRNTVEEVLPKQTKYRFERIVFVGFNSLTTTEYRIMSHFRQANIGDYYFDYPTQFSGESAFASTVAMNYEENLKLFPSRYEYNQDTKKHIPEISMHGTPSVTNQAQITANILDELHKKGEQVESNTAILLSDESVLPTLLQTLPNFIKRLNVTMGYPLNLAPISSLIECIISLQLEISTKAGKAQFYHKPLLDILTHPYIQKQFTILSNNITKQLTRYNYIKISEETLHELIDKCNVDEEEKQFFKTIFKAQNSIENMFEYLNHILEMLQKQYTDNNTEKEITPINSYQFELEYIFQYQKYLNQLYYCLQHNDITIEKKTLSALIARITSSLKVQFKGEPLEGLQVMGMLEGRMIDFKNVILLGFNDNKIPGTKSVNSLIPYNLRRAYGLPTYENNDAIFAYNFYRMLYRTDNISFVYDSRKEGAKSEISRFYYQLLYLMPQTIGKEPTIKHITYNLPLTPREDNIENKSLVIEKSENIMLVLNRYKSDKSDRYLSASRLKEYISCPLKFYFSTIAGIATPNEINETIQSNLFGSIFHKSMELYYNEHKTAHKVTQEYIKRLVSRAFEIEGEENNKHIELTGFNILTYNILVKFVTNTIEFDLKRNEFEYLDSEKEIYDEIDGVKFKGFIDRLDRDIFGVTHIIDYKTSITEKGKVDLVDMFTSADTFHHEICQILFYCRMYQNGEKNKNEIIKPNLYKIYTLNRNKGGELKDIKIEVPIKLRGETLPETTSVSFEELATDEKELVVVKNYNDIKIPFEWMLKKTINEMFDQRRPFCANPNDTKAEACTYCPYISMCEKEKEVKSKLSI